MIKEHPAKKEFLFSPLTAGRIIYNPGTAYIDNPLISNTTPVESR